MHCINNWKSSLNNIKKKKPEAGSYTHYQNSMYINNKTLHDRTSLTMVVFSPSQSLSNAYFSIVHSAINASDQKQEKHKILQQATFYFSE